MKIYIDLVFLLNFIYDFLILMTVDITLKRHTKLRRIFLGAFVGALSLILLFLKMSVSILFVFKILVSILMIIITFNYQNIKNFCHNLFYLYMISITLAGFLYFLNTQFSYKQTGLVFYFDGISTNYILLIIIAPIILYLYIREHKLIKKTYNLIYEVQIIFKNNKVLKCLGYLDSGNKLKDPITQKYIILVENNILKKYIMDINPLYVPYHALNKRGLVKCYKIKTIIVNNHSYHNYLVGEANKKFAMAGINCLLNNKLMEDL